MSHVIKFNSHTRREIELKSEADSRLCWICGSCDFECPVNIATFGRLKPRKIVRMANLGLKENLLELPEIWYCLTCRKCARVCPNSVKPYRIIEHIRSEVLSKKMIPWETYLGYQRLVRKFQRVRYRVTAECIEGYIPELAEDQWRKWMEMPLSDPIDCTIHGKGYTEFTKYRRELESNRVMSCYTCGECSSACPISGERALFDPRAVIRKIQLGLIDELLASPTIWLCIQCGRCADNCIQNVDCSETIACLRKLAIEKGIVDEGIYFRLEFADRILYPWFIREIDSLFGRYLFFQDSKDVDFLEDMLTAASFH